MEIIGIEESFAKPVGTLQTTDIDGRIVNSSKRFWGSILCGSGAALLIFAGFSSVFFEIADPDTVIKIGSSLIATGAILLGIGVLDNLGQSIGRKIGGEN